MSRRPIIALTPGEPAGIGPDVAIAFAQQAPDCDLVLIADLAMLTARAAQLNLTFNARPWSGRGNDIPAVYVLPIATSHPVKAGRLDPANSPYVIECLRRAVQGCRRHEFDALVTGPVHKGVINDAGIPFTGHTEFLAAESGTAQVVMMLAAPGRSPSAATHMEVQVSREAGRRERPKRRDARERPPGLRVALATTHLPLSEVSRAITREHLTGVLRILHTDLRAKFGVSDPQILVCGLNPHAGEGGHLGREEIEVIEPVLAALRVEGFKLHGPVPADTAFIPASLVGVDAVLAMYHDQGLPVLKAHDFAHAINITLGLPFVRTSVDHGTALELAGSGRADPSSLRAAVEAALNMVKPQMNTDEYR
ncbi:MAG: 4-hydroxythreonine-4-phosphate dehydrogenase [Proteobacteria bacterium]|nr:4-hydroxythreonine-4-phosphate dehydrogenase [Pseudomonadota bacterium]